jgi:hypothetical protein
MHTTYSTFGTQLASMVPNYQRYVNEVTHSYTLQLFSSDTSKASLLQLLLVHHDEHYTAAHSVVNFCMRQECSVLCMCRR